MATSQDPIVSQMATFLQSKGVAPTTPAPSATGSNWFSQITPPVAKTQDSMLGNEGYAGAVGKEELAGASKVVSSVEKGAQDLQSAGTEKNPIKALGDVAGDFIDAGAGTVNGVARALFAPVTPAISKIVSWVTPTLVQQNPILAKVYNAVAPAVDDFAQAHPEMASRIGDVLNTALLAVGGGASEDTVKNAVDESLTKDGAINTAKDIASAPAKIINGAGDAVDAVQNKISAGNVQPNLETSVNRLSNAGEDPAQIHADYVAQQQAHLKDVKVPDAQGLWGTTDFSNAVDSVIKQRSEAGATMGAEMKGCNRTN